MLIPRAEAEQCKLGTDTGRDANPTVRLCEKRKRLKNCPAPPVPLAAWGACMELKVSAALTARTPYLLPFEFFPLTDQLDEQTCPLQVMTQFLPVLQLFLYCTGLLILLLLEDIAVGLEIKPLSRCPL